MRIERLWGWPESRLNFERADPRLKGTFSLQHEGQTDYYFLVEGRIEILREDGSREGVRAPAALILTTGDSVTYTVTDDLRWWHFETRSDVPCET